MDRSKDCPWGKCEQCGREDSSNGLHTVPGALPFICSVCAMNAQRVRSARFPMEVPYVFDHENAQRWQNYFYTKKLPRNLTNEEIDRLSEGFEANGYAYSARKVKEYRG